MTNEEVLAIKALAEEATPGISPRHIYGLHEGCAICTLQHQQGARNYNFIESARENTIALCDEVEALKSERDRFKARAEAAERDIKQMLQGDELEGLCVFCRCYGNMGSVCCKDAEWRGPQEGANE